MGPWTEFCVCFFGDFELFFLKWLSRLCKFLAPQNPDPSLLDPDLSLAAVLPPSSFYSKPFLLFCKILLETMSLN